MQLSEQYELRVEGIVDAPAHLGEAYLWHKHDRSSTLIMVRATDQCALFGLLKRIRDSGLTLVSLNRV